MMMVCLCPMMFGLPAEKTLWVKVTQSLGPETAVLEDLLPN